MSYFDQELWPMLELKTRAALREQGRDDLAVKAITAAVEQRIRHMPPAMTLSVPRDLWEMIAEEVNEKAHDLISYFLATILELEIELYEARAPFARLQ